jgi:hypothetical protein
MSEMALPREEHSGLTRLLEFGALAALLRGGLRIAAVVAEQGRQVQADLSPGAVLDVLSILPGILVLLVWLRLANVLRSNGLYRASLYLFVNGWLVELLHLVNPTHVSDTVEIVAAVVKIGLLVLDIVFSIWFAIAVLRLRDVLGGFALAVGILEVAGVVLWLGIKALLVASLASGDQSNAGFEQTMESSLISQVDFVRAIAWRGVYALVLFAGFPALRDRLSALPAPTPATQPSSPSNPFDPSLSWPWDAAPVGDGAGWRAPPIIIRGPEVQNTFIIVKERY